MKNINEMTPDELRNLADKIEKRERKKIYKIGYLKEDKYFLDVCGDFGGIDILSELTKEQIDNSIIPNIKNIFKLEIPKNTKFVARKNINYGGFLWEATIGDKNYLKHDEWAVGNLINIVEL